jgi:Flp pilus assembly protein TadB
MTTQFLHISAKILLVFWVIGFFLFGLGALVHLLLILVVISLIARYLLGSKIIDKNKKVKLDKLIEHKINNIPK